MILGGYGNHGCLGRLLEPRLTLLGQLFRYVVDPT